MHQPIEKMTVHCLSQLVASAGGSVWPSSDLCYILRKVEDLGVYLCQIGSERPATGSVRIV